MHHNRNGMLLVEKADLVLAKIINKELEKPNFSMPGALYLDATEQI